MREKSNPEHSTGQSAWPDTLVARQNLDALSALARAIGMAAPGRFVLLLAKCNLPSQRETLTEQLRAMLEALDVELVDISPDGPVDNLLTLLQISLQSRPRPTQRRDPDSDRPPLAVGVHHLEASIRSADPHPPILAHLNLARERYKELLACPLVLWLPDYALTRLAREAPDFWAWRSGVFQFAPEADIAQSALRRLAYEPGIATSNLDAAAKRERLALLEQLLADYRELGDGPQEQDAQAAILFEMGHLRQDLGDYDEARRFYQQSLDIKQQLGDRAGIAATLHQLGGLAQFQGDYDEARRFYQQSLDIKQQLGNRVGISISLHQLGTLAGLQGNYDEARRLYQQSLDIKQQLGDRAGTAITVWSLGNVAYLQSDLDTARSQYQDALAVFKELGDRKNEAGVLQQLGRLAELQGDDDEARRIYQQSLDIKQQLGNRAGSAISLHQLGRLAEKDGDLEKAERLFAESLSILEALGSPDAAIARRSLERVRKQ